MGAIAYTELKKNLQDKGLWFWTFILPIVFIVGFMAIFSGGEDMNPLDLVTHIIPGYTVMFSFFIMISMVITFVKDRDSGIVARIASTPLPSYHYFIGKWIPFGILVMIQIIVLFAFGFLVYDLPLGNPLALIVLSLALAFISTGWGMALAVLAKTENMGIAITQIIAMGGAVLGGLWMPLEHMPSFIQSFAKFLPQYWALVGYQEILLFNVSLWEIWRPLLILVFLGSVGAVIAVCSYSRFLRLSKK